MEQEIAWVKTVTEELDERGGDRVKRACVCRYMFMYTLM